MSYQPLSPHQIEAKLVQSVTELTNAEKALGQARDVEVDCELVYESAKRRAMLSDACPRVARDAATVAERDAWVADQVADEYRAYRLAQVALKAAEDHQRRVREVTSTVQTIASLCKAALSLAGHA